MTESSAAHSAVAGVSDAADAIVLRRSDIIRAARRTHATGRGRRACMLMALAGTLTVLPFDLAIAPGQRTDTASAKPVEAVIVPGGRIALAPQSRSPSNLFGLEDIRKRVDAMMRSLASGINLPQAHEIHGSLAQAEPQPVQVAGRSLPRDLVDVVVLAARATDIDPTYLMALADKESSFDPAAKAPTSSAEGMFQFIDKTWLAVVHQHGAGHGLASEAKAITAIGDDFVVSDEETKARIMELRREPYLAAVLAAEMLKRDRAEVGFRIGRDLRRSEYYLTHFLGQKQAGRLLELLDADPDRSAAAEFPAAAKANRSIFMSSEATIAGKGKSRRRVVRQRPATIAEVYERLGRMMEVRLVRYGQVASLVGADGETGG